MRSPIIKALAKAIYSLTTYSQWTAFHSAMLSLLATGAFMVVSAAEMGAIGPILVSLGICVIFFALMSEGILILRVLLKVLILRLASSNSDGS
ncbi:MAG: hypothetical protein CFE44_22755 [Burkholderiales bacterium PBB4]|nr:MAG: hypothetical protein CFE44_22755 [Burkholderiales bacterium PBB4]